MADPAPTLMPNEEVRFERARVAALLKTLEDMASGDVDARVPISPRHDELDAMAHAINVLVGELRWAHARAKQTQEDNAAELRAAVASAEAHSGAILKANPDLMFVLLRDGTFVEHHAGDPKLLLVPAEAFIGRTVRDIMPPAVAEDMMNAIERAFRSADPVVVEYELPMSEPRFFEARIVQKSADRVLSIVRDVTEFKRAAELNRDLARRLISRAETERQRIAQELHDDIGQRIALMNIEIDAIAVQIGSKPLRSRLDKLYAQANEIARDLHQMSFELHPSRLQTLGLVGALQGLCRDMSTQRNLHVAFAHGAIPPTLDESLSLCVYRIAQEALHNAARHSRAPEVQVGLTCDGQFIVLRIADSGVGFDPAQLHNGLGLVSMHERVTTMNGQLAIEAVPDGGTRVIVRIPLGLHSASSATAAVAST